MKLNALMDKIKNGYSKKGIPSNNLAMEDINRGLYEALFAISIYGDTVRDDEIMEIIINGTDNTSSKLYKTRKALYDEFVKHLQNGDYVRSGDVLLDKEGRIKLQPKQVI